MSNIVEGVGSALGVLGNVLLKGAIEGGKLGYGAGKITGKIVKETVKGVAKGVGAVGKAIIEK